MADEEREENAEREQSERHLDDCPVDEDTKVIAPFVVAYYDWLRGEGSIDPEALLAMPLTPAQRELLMERIDDVNFVYAITSPIRIANKTAAEAERVVAGDTAGKNLN